MAESICIKLSLASVRFLAAYGTGYLQMAPFLPLIAYFVIPTYRIPARTALFRRKEPLFSIHGFRLEFPFLVRALSVKQLASWTRRGA